MEKDYVMRVAAHNPAPVIDIDHPGAAGNQGGFENGHVIKINGLYHMVITELFWVVYADWGSVPARIGYWTSADGGNWTRVCTIVQGTATGKPEDLRDPKCNTWSASWYWNEKENRWNIFVRGWGMFRYRSEIEGPDGMAGPYSEAGQVTPPICGAHMEWENPNGNIASFSNIYTGKDGRYYSLAGTGKDSGDKDDAWLVSLIGAENPEGPWSWVYTGERPVFLYAENPFVSVCDINGEKVYFCVYDDLSNQHSLGYGYSRDGIHWTGKTMDLTGCADWAFNKNFTQSVRTPCGLIQENDGIYTIIFTAFAPNENAPEYCWGSYAKVGRVNVRIDESERPSNQNAVFPGDMKNWTASSGSFRVKYGLYCQNEEKHSGYTSVFSKEKYENAGIEATLRYVDSSQQWDENAKAGVFVRKINIDDTPEDSGYHAYLTARETVQLYAGRKLLAEADVKKRPAIFRKLRLSVSGDNIRVYYDGASEPCIETTDGSYAQSGYAGIAVCMSHWHYERVEITNKNN
jgi:hypothetical protein